jgi:signal transduction histidine kinase
MQDGTWEGELIHSRRDGARITVFSRWSRVDGGQDGAAVLEINRDITERLLLREEQEKNQRLESLGLLAGGIAHDFNNILTGILGNLSLARMMIDSEHRAAGRLAECEKATLRAGELTRQLLTFARGGEPVKKLVDISRLVNEAVSFVLRGSAVKGVVDLPEGVWAIDADEGQIIQALNNLLINAKQAMPQGGTVTVKGENFVTKRSFNSGTAFCAPDHTGHGRRYPR